ncbi:MAG: hypothetical protein K2P57_01170 [Burkholderiales bacterium]|nr:hypothetical protein [Burkholderiales bacterium]
MIKPITALAALALLGSCSSMLPKAEVTTISPWHSFQEVQQVFDSIVPHKTTADDLRKLGLDPQTNPNITLLNYSDVLRRFIPSPSVDAHDLDAGVQECILAKSACEGYEIRQSTTRRIRYGNFWADFLNFRRKVDIAGWRFNGVILIRDKIVVYKLTGGEPAIHEFEENRNPLGPFQGMGSSRLP